METFLVREGSIEEAVSLSRKIPELINPHEVPVYEERLSEKPHLILIATVDQEPVGFKVGYERSATFYSWMGGVLPGFRQKGIAKLLAEEQEKWVIRHGYTTISFKTRNSHKGMLIFALKNGFNITGFISKNKIEDSRILLQKKLTT